MHYVVTFRERVFPWLMVVRRFVLVRREHFYLACLYITHTQLGNVIYSVANKPFVG